MTVSAPPRYRFSSGFRSRKLSASDIATELERIQKVKGTLTSEGVFDSAKPADSKLHPEFEWDGDEAIHQLGLLRARSMIRAVVVIEADDPEPMRVWVHVPDESRNIFSAGTYEKMTIVGKDIDQYELAMGELEVKLKSALEAVRMLKRASGTTSGVLRLEASLSEAVVTLTEMKG